MHEVRWNLLRGYRGNISELVVLSVEENGYLSEPNGYIAHVF